VIIDVLADLTEAILVTVYVKRNVSDALMSNLARGI